MRHDRSLGFDDLEERKLLSKVHHVVVHPAIKAKPVVPLVVDGTLTVNNRATSSSMNQDGGMTTSIPVTGSLGALGAVRGIWSETVDSFGDYEGPDSLQLRNSKGSFILVFNNENADKALRVPHGTVTFEVPQKAYAGSGAYARPSESGSIELTSNAARTGIVSLTLKTGPA